MNSKEFNTLKQITETKLTFSEDNFQSKLAEVPLLYSRYLQIFVNENKNLMELKLKKEVKYADLYRYFKYSANERWDTKSEIEAQMYSDLGFQSIISDINSQQEIVTFLEQTLDNIKTLSFAVRNHIAWQKFINADTSNF
jgi:delta 1-pyrroline-5-carboxylate dehydrogenase